MSVLLFIIGGIAVMVGAATVAFGIPINEFSFGNTLIVAGTTIGTGGLIIIAIAAAVRQLSRVAEVLAARAETFPHEAVEPPPQARGAPAPGRVPFPPKTRPAEPPGFEPPAPAEAAHAEEPPGQSFAPVLPNPEASPAEEEFPLPPPSVPARPAAEPPPEPALGERWRAAPPPPPPPPPLPPREPAAAASFDAMWPEKASKPALQPEPEPAPELAPPAHEPRNQEPPTHAVAILKSGVVDGMGYTLYVDGSIEAELPQGTLRFSSIDELRAHLEKGV